MISLPSSQKNKIGTRSLKKGVWGCTEQLLINKSNLSEVRNKKKNLITIWLDDKKAFDSIPHEWLIKSLHLAKLPEDLIRAIEHLTSQWSTYRFTLKR